MKIGFALIPKEQTLNKIVRVENTLHDRFGFCDRLGTDHNLPHITIFQGDLKEELDPREVLDTIVAEAPDKVFLSDMIYMPNGWYFWKCVKTDGLAALHNKVLKIVSPYIICGPISESEVLTPVEYEAAKRYGYRYAGEAFMPHITIGRADGEDPAILKTLSQILTPEKVPIERATVYRMGNNGTHAETLFQNFF